MPHPALLYNRENSEKAVFPFAFSASFRPASGKRVCEFSMLDDQRYILEQILSLLDSTPVDGVLLAGDLYDKPVPLPKPCAAGLVPHPAGRTQLPVFAISGNHDSADRIAFGSALLQNSRVYVSPVFSGAPVPSPSPTSTAR